jgi:ribosomal-protein-alanine N-acetyltransferase
VKPPRTKAGYAALLRQARRRSYEAFFVRASETGELAGAVWITEIVRGVFRSGYLSYYGFAPTAGRGLMGAGLAAVIRQAFRDIGLRAGPRGRGRPALRRRRSDSSSNKGES